MSAIASVLATGAAWAAGMAAVVVPALYLAAPTLTDSGRSRVGVEITRDFASGVKEFLAPTARRWREVLSA